MSRETKGRIKKSKHQGYEYMYLLMLFLLALGVSFLFSFSRAPICSDQLDIWIGVFLAYVSLSAIVSAIFVYWIQSTQEESKRDYRRVAKVVTQDNIHFRLLKYLLCTFIIFVIALTAQACIRVWILVFLFTIALIPPVLEMLFRIINKIYMVNHEPYRLIELAKKRLRKLLKIDLSTIQHNCNLDIQYTDDIEYVAKIVCSNIRDNRIEQAKNAMRWLKDVVVFQITQVICFEQIQLIGVLLSAVRDSYARVLIEAASFRFHGGVNPGLLEEMLEDVELSSQEFIKPGYSTAFHYLLDSIQLAYDNAPKPHILDEYISFFIRSGNLRAQIKVLDIPEDRQEYKLVVLSTTLVLICYSFRSPDCSASCARLINMLLDFDTAFLKEEEVAEDYTGLGCWLLVFRLLWLVSQSNPNEGIQQNAYKQYQAMLIRATDPDFPKDCLEEAGECMSRHSEMVLKSSTGSSFYFCINECLPRYHGRTDSYVQGAIEALR